MNGFTLSPKHFAIWLGVVAATGLDLSYVTGLSYWGASAMVMAALAITGFVAEIEDRSPGGFLGTSKKLPTPSARPPSDA